MSTKKSEDFGACVYVSLKRNVIVANYSVCIKDIGEVFCEDKDVKNQIQNHVIERLKHKETKVISSIYVVEQIQKMFPGKIILPLGENDVIISLKTKMDNKLTTVLKVVFVAMVIFFGTGFTIMAFHGDIGIDKMFGNIYRQMTGQVSDGTTILEYSYTIGIVIGILVFFNHIRGKKVTPEPTPVQVQMRDYEKKMDQAFVENVSRKGSEESVE